MGTRRRRKRRRKRGVLECLVCPDAAKEMGSTLSAQIFFPGPPPLTMLRRLLDTVIHPGTKPRHSLAWERRRRGTGRLRMRRLQPSTRRRNAGASSTPTCEPTEAIRTVVTAWMSSREGSAQYVSFANPPTSVQTAPREKGEQEISLTRAQCRRLRLLKLERVKDYLLMEEEFVKNQERLKPTDDSAQQELDKVPIRLNCSPNCCCDQQSQKQSEPAEASRK